MAEADAVKSILNGQHCVLGSEFLDMEIDMIKDAKKLDKVSSLYQLISEYIKADEAIFSRAVQLCSCSSLGNMDSLHIAAAEAGKADVFLTVDDRLIRSCRGAAVSVRICNPAEFLEEGENDGSEG